MTFSWRPQDKAPGESEQPGYIEAKFPDMLSLEIAKDKANTVRTVQYFNCAGYKFGERRKQ